MESCTKCEFTEGEENFLVRIVSEHDVCLTEHKCKKDGKIPNRTSWVCEDDPDATGQTQTSDVDMYEEGQDELVKEEMDMYPLISSMDKQLHGKTMNKNTFEQKLIENLEHYKESYEQIKDPDGDGDDAAEDTAAAKTSPSTTDTSPSLLEFKSTLKSRGAATGYCSDYKYMTDGTVQSGKYRVRNTGSCPSSYVESCHATKGCFCSKTKDTCSSWKFDKHYKTVKHVGWTTCGKSKETLKTWPDTGIVIFPTKYKLTCAVLDVESRSTAPLCSCTKDGHVEYLQSKCLVLPGSMNGGKHPRGCPGAVWSNGKPASTYCNGKGGKYPWWKDCCQWKGGSCKPKPVALIQHEPSLAKCLVLPGSMNGGKHPRGCPGAVWSSGSPAGSYCNGKGGKYPWWRDCCQWKDGSCKPKSVAVHQDVVASWDEKKYGKNGVDLVVKYIQRWVKGAVGSTCDTTCGAKGLMCDSDAQTKLNTNEKVKAAFAEAGYTCKSFHPARTYGGTPFSTGRAKDDCTPFLAGAKRSVCDSNPHKNHAPLCSCM